MFTVPWIHGYDSYFLKYFSFILELVKSAEGDNQESAEGSIKVRFGAQVEVKIIFFYQMLLKKNVMAWSN